jgi:8-oxo-dGTP pyrophosphatase MutT (NUDIX family)
MSEPLKMAAVSMVRRYSSATKYLCVWNKRYGGWCFPGGKVEDGETVIDAHEREFRDETGCTVSNASLIYDAPSVHTGRQVFVFIVYGYDGVPHEAEAGSPCEWMTQERLLAESPFKEFYKKMFEYLERPRRWESPSQ